MRRVPPHAGRALLLGLAYAGLSLVIDAASAFDSPIGSAFWPQSGLTLAALLLAPRRAWPLYLAAVFAAETCADLEMGFEPDVALTMALANVAEPLVGATVLLRLAGGDPDLRRRRGLTAFVLGGVVAGPVVGAVVGSIGPALVAGDTVFPRMGRWFVGDAVGVLVVTPLALAVARDGGLRLDADAVATLVVVVGVAVLVVGPFEAPADWGLPFLVLPALAFAALRLPHGGATLAIALVALVVEVVSVTGQGPFAHEGPFGGIVVVQMFLAMASLTTLAMGVLVREVVTRDALAETLRDQALHDSLTGLANRRLLFDRVDHARRRLARGTSEIALLYVDLDGFKAINDARGHLVGDRVLRRTADRLRDAVREGDTVARIGGDEFVVLVEDVTDRADVDALAARLVRTCGAPIEVDGDVVEVGVSVGVVVSGSADDDVDALVGRADRAMYAAKTAGGGRRALAGV